MKNTKQTDKHCYKVTRIEQDGTESVYYIEEPTPEELKKLHEKPTQRKQRVEE